MPLPRCRCKSFRHIVQFSIALLALQCAAQVVAQDAIGEGLSRNHQATASIPFDSAQVGPYEVGPSFEPPSTEWTKFDKVVIAHAVIGSIAWMIISPVAIVVARASSSSFRACTITQSIVTSGLTIAAVILGCIATKIGPSSSHFESSHQQMGLVLMILLLLQLLLGRIFAHNRGIDIRLLRASDYIHTTLSIVLSAIGFAQIWLGMELYEAKSGRKTPLAAKVIWAIIVATFSVLLTIFAIKKQLRTSSKPSISLKGYSKRHKRKATIYMNKHHERGIRSDGLWIGVMGENASGSTFVSSYTDTTVFSEASKDPGLTLSDRKAIHSPDSLIISSLWLNDLERDMPIDPSTLPVYQADQSYSNRAPASGIELSLPSTSVSPLVPIIEVDSEEEDNIEGPGLSNSKDDVVDVVESRPTSWVSSGAASIDTAWSDQPSQSPRSRSKSIKRKPVPLS